MKIIRHSYSELLRHSRCIASWLVSATIILFKSALLLSFSFFCNCFLVRSEPIDAADTPLEISHIRGDVYLAEDYNYWKSNYVFILNDHGAVFVNAGWTSKSARQILWKASTLTYAEFQAVVATSYKLHYTGGLNEFKNQDVPIYLSAKSEQLLRKNWDRMQEEMIPFGSFRKSPAPKSDLLIQDNLKLMNDRVHVLNPGRGVSEDNLAVYFPVEKVLYAGDLFSEPEYFDDLHDTAAKISARQKLLELPFEILVSGHGKAIRNRAWAISKTK